MKHKTILVALAVLFLAVSHGVQAGPLGASHNTPPSSEVEDRVSFFEQITTECRLERPGQTQRMHVSCNKATYLDVQVADCCIPGDHWELKVKVGDAAPNTGVATSPGPAGTFSAPARVYSHGDDTLEALIECRYLHGVNVFPAGAFLDLTTDGECEIQQQGAADEISRTP